MDSKNILDINNKLDVDRIMKLVDDQSMEWAFGQGTEQGEEREMVSQSFIEGAKLVISLLQGDENVMDMLMNDDITSCSIKNIKKWVDENIGYYDECENVSCATDDMIHDFKIHFLKIGLDDTFENEKELIIYFKSEWEQYYN